MTIKKVSPDSIETFSIVTNPSRTYSSSSQGTTGSVYVFARRSSFEKETRPLPAFVERTRNDHDLESFLRTLVQSSYGTTNIAGGVESYMSGVRAQGVSARKQKSLEILRFTPSYTFTSNTMRKLLVKDTLMPYYRSSNPGYNYGFTNYHSLNFFTASSVSPSTVLLYPNTPVATNGFISGTYVPTGSFTFGFHINPRYTHEYLSSFKAGTIMHLSSTFAVSLVTGSLKDVNGLASGFRILLQLSHSADVRPSVAVQGSNPNNLVFLSDDNSLRRNSWHDVVIRWGTSHIENGTGSFVIDGVQRGTFVVPSASIAPRPFVGKANPDVLCVGNFYEGTNAFSTNMQALFFATNPSTRDGLQLMFADASDIEKPASFTFNHPLNAEVHDLFIRDEYTTDAEIFSGSGKTPASLDDFLFYLPPFFTHESPTRRYIDTHGGVLQTPFFAVDGTTSDPFNLALSFGVAGHYVNLENFTRDFVTGYFPRALNLTASEINNTTTAMSCNDFLYITESVRKRNLTVLPCDDGTFYPDYRHITTFSTETLRFCDDIGADENGSFISLDHLVPLSSLIQTVGFESGSLFEKITGPSPENLGLQSGSVFSIFQRTRDPSSNEVVFFDISNLYYGNKISPGSFSIRDASLTGSSGKVSMTLRDDGLGNLYRADCVTSHSKWNNVGNVFYNEGIVVVKSPMVPFFGKDQFELSFKGEQNIHTMTINVLASANTLNSSSNAAYQKLSASFDANREEQGFVYLTGLHLHDDNLNVIAKTQLVQPIVKRFGDKILFRIKIDM